MTLFRYPEINKLSRDQLESHIEEVRARRMAAAVVYFEGKNAKLSAIDQKLERRLAGQYDLLGKEIMQLDKMLAKVEKRANAIERLNNEQGLTRDQMVFVGSDSDETEEE